MKEVKSKPDIDRFVGVAGLIGCFLVPVLQSNGVELNWEWSIAAYFVCLSFVQWSLWKYVLPGESCRAHVLTFCTVTLVLGYLAFYAISKQFKREVLEEEASIRFLTAGTITPEVEQVGTPYLTQVELHNSSNKELEAVLSCGIIRAPVRRRVVDVGDDAKLHQKAEQVIFAHISSKPYLSTPFTLRAESTQFGYCHSNWSPDQSEIDALDRGDISLYTVGRLIVPSTSENKHGEVDFCYTGTLKMGITPCYGYNLTHLEEGRPFK